MRALLEEFRVAFGADAGLEECDFRPHFDGHLRNASRLVRPSATREAHVALVWSYIREMAAWLLERRNSFHSGDRFQLVVGWPEDIRATSRQIVKIGGGFDELVAIATAKTFSAYQAASNSPIFRHGWDIGIYR